MDARPSAWTAPTPRLVYRRLLKSYGPQGWWPVTPLHEKTPVYRPGFWGDLSEKECLEICLGAILTQNTNWENVRKALIRLKSAGVLDLKKILELELRKLQSLIRSSGYFRQKSRKIKIFVETVSSRGDSLKKWLSGSLDKTREELLDLWGIGPETADSILLYAGHRPVFVIDAYTMRITRRMGWMKNPQYFRLQKFFEKNLSKKSFLYAEFHALLVALAKNHCRTKPVCSGCPVLDICAHGLKAVRVR